MNLTDVTVFVEAVKAGSLAAAGRRLGITAMIASRRLATLEDELGARLLHRSTRALALTPEGEAFLPHAQAMLEQEASGRAALRPAAAGASGLLRVTASAPFGHKLVMPMLPEFLRSNPEVRVDLLLSDRLIDIVGQGIDLALRIGALRDNTLVAKRLCDNPRGLYAAPEYLARRGQPTQLAELASHECLVTSGVTHWTFQREARSVQQRVSGRFTASGVEALHRACLAGLGIVRLSAWNMHDDVRAGRLVEITLHDAHLSEQSIWAVYPTAHLVPPKVRVFVSALERSLRTLPDGALTRR